MTTSITKSCWLPSTVATIRDSTSGSLDFGWCWRVRQPKNHPHLTGFRPHRWIISASQVSDGHQSAAQWRLIHAGADYDAGCEWDTNLWFEEGELGLLVVALRSRLGVQALSPEMAGKPSPLAAAAR